MDVQFPDRTKTGSHTIVPGLEMEWLHGGKVVAYTLTKPTREVVEAYFNINTRLMDMWDTETPDELFISLHDVSDNHMSLTPQMRSRLNDIAQRIKTGKTQHRSAVILQKSLFGTVFSLFGNMFSRSAKNTIQQYFTERPKALEWLQQYVVTASKKA
jgi:hypothetical protein